MTNFEKITKNEKALARVLATNCDNYCACVAPEYCVVSVCFKEILAWLHSEAEDGQEVHR